MHLLVISNKKSTVHGHESLEIKKKTYCFKHDFRLLQQCRWDLHSAGILCSVAGIITLCCVISQKSTEKQIQFLPLSTFNSKHIAQGFFCDVNWLASRSVQQTNYVPLWISLLYNTHCHRHVQVYIKHSDLENQKYVIVNTKRVLN